MDLLARDFALCQREGCLGEGIAIGERMLGLMDQLGWETCFHAVLILLANLGLFVVFFF